MSTGGFSVALSREVMIGRLVYPCLMVVHRNAFKVHSHLPPGQVYVSPCIYVNSTRALHSPPSLSATSNVLLNDVVGLHGMG